MRFFFNVLVPCSPKESEYLKIDFIVVMLLLSAMPPLRLYHRIIWVSLINNVLKVFLCSANKKKIFSITGTARNCRFMQKNAEFFPLTQIMHSCSNSIRKVPLYLAATIEKKFPRHSAKLKFVIKSMRKYFYKTFLFFHCCKFLCYENLLSPFFGNVNNWLRLFLRSWPTLLSISVNNKSRWYLLKIINQNY